MGVGLGSKLLTAVFLMVALSIALSALSLLRAQPSPVQSLLVNHGVISYYSSMPTSTPPGLIIRVYAINGSSIYPVRAFVAIYGLTPRHIVPIEYGLGPAIDVPFNNTNWLFIANKWLSFNPAINDYNTSLLIFITYIADNESWMEAYSIPYNIGWVIHNSAPKGIIPLTGYPGSINYIVLTAYINLSAKPLKVVPAKPPEIRRDQSISVGPYTVYNCSEEAPSPPTFYEAGYYTTVYSPTTMCVGFTGPIPLAWVTWGEGIVNEYENYGLNFELDISLTGPTDWYATAYENGQFGIIGTSYSETVYWTGTTPYTLNSSIMGEGSGYIYYDGTFAIVNYSVYVYNTRLGIYEYVGQVPVVEVISVSSPAGSSSPPYVSPYVLSAAYDFGNGPISMIYNGLITLAEQELGYPVLNRSTVVTYASWEQGTSGPGCATLSPGQELGEDEWVINLESIDEQYRLSGPELGYELGSLGLEAIDMAVKEGLISVGSALADFLGGFGVIVDLIGLIIPSNTQISVQQTQLIIFVPTSNVDYVTWYVTIITASNYFGVPTFGFIINATNYYQNAYNCNG